MEENTEQQTQPSVFQRFMILVIRIAVCWVAVLLLISVMVLACKAFLWTLYL